MANTVPISCRNSAATAMKGIFADAEVRQSMQDVLQRLHALDVKENAEAAAPVPSSLSDEITDPLSQLSQAGLQLLRRMKVSDSFDFDTLPASDQRELTRLFSSTAMDTVIPWQPWWHAPGASQIRLNEEGQGLVSANQSEAETEDIHDCRGCGAMSASPSPPKSALPTLGSLTSTTPHPQLHLSLLQTLFAYCAALFLYNGDPEGDLPGYVDMLWQLAPHLWQTTAPGCLPTSCRAAFCESLNRLRKADDVAGRLNVGDEFGRWAWASVVSICDSGRGAVVCAMAHLQRQHEAGKREARRALHHVRKQSRASFQVCRKRYKIAMHKIHYQLVFANACLNEQYRSWATEIRSLIQQDQVPPRSLHSMLLMDAR